MTRLVALVAALLIAVPVFGASPDPDPKNLAIPPEEVSKARELVRKLGSEVYREREEAHAELLKMGRAARTALLEGVASDPDPEVRFRCSRLLPKAGADDLKARLDTFLADTEGKFEHDLPGLKQFRKAVGTDEKARTLFVEIVKTPYNVEVLQALDRGPTEAGRAVADRRNLLYGNLQNRNIGGRFQPPQPLNLPDIACLLFAESFVPSKEIPRTGMFSHVTGATFVQQPASVTAINNGTAAHADAYKRIVAAWMETRDDVQDLNQLSYIAGQQLRSFPQSLPLLKKIVNTEGTYGYAKGQALMYLVQTRGKEEIPFLKTLLSNDTMVTTVWFGQNGNQPIQHQCLLRDVALAMMLSQTNQKLQDYGFKFPQGQIPNNQNIGYGNYAFEKDEDRAAAMVKFGFWQLKQGFKDPNAKEPEPKKDEPRKGGPPPVPQPRPDR